MSTLTDFIVNYGDVVDLEFDNFWNTTKIFDVLNKHPGWKVYSPHKPGYNRFGLSVTSHDGGYSGIPDLGSLREYNKLHDTNFVESSFQTRTNIVDFIPELNSFLDFYGPNLGRTHFIRLDKGGFFPPHRDNGAFVSVPTFRIFVPIYNFDVNHVKWVQEDKVLQFTAGKVYFINTTKIHSIFSFVDNCMMLVVNVMWDERILSKLVHKVCAI